MRIVVQRVSEASVRVDGEITGEIGSGLLVFLGVETEDTSDDARWLAEKVTRLRIFADENQVMNRSVTDVGGDILLVSQFTLHALTKKGNRPSYIRAARPQQSQPLYNEFVQLLQNELKKPVATGIFGADMKVSLVNDGPVTILIDSKNRE